MGRILFSQPGVAGVLALRTVLDEVRAGDRLAPVDVIVPTGIAGVTVRRALAGDAGLANVRFSALPQVAEHLAARHLALAGDAVSRPLTAAIRSQAVRATVAQADGTLARAAKHPGTLSLLEGLMAELDEVLPDHVLFDSEAGKPDALSANAVEVLSLFADYRSRVSDLVTPRQMLSRAIEAIEAGNAPQIQVILYAPSRLTASEKVFLSGLHLHRRLSAVLTAAPDDTAEWLRGMFGEGPREPARQPAYGDMHLRVAPDAEEEVRLVVRTVLARLEDASCRPERIGIAYRAGTPYARLLQEQLKGAGVPHHVPSQRSLDQTIAGRVTLGLLELHGHDFPRADVIRWLSEGPLVDGEGRHVPADRWDRRSREAGVARGSETWAVQLKRYADEQERQAAKLTADEADRPADEPDRAPDDSHRPADEADRAANQPDPGAGFHRRAEDALALAAFVASAAAAGERIALATSWAEVAESLTAALTLFLGKRSKVDLWTSRDSSLTSEVALEQSSYDAVLVCIAALAELDDSIEAPGPSTVLESLRFELDRSVSSGTTMGRGVLVGPYSQFVGSDLDLLCVVGMTEDSFPPRTREHAILRDADRHRISGELRTVAARRDDERERWVAVLHCAQNYELSYPRANTRSQRRQFAAPWFLEQATRLNGGDLVGASTVESLDRGWHTVSPSFVASLDQATTFASAQELDVSRAMRGGLDALAADDPRLLRGVAANRARMHGEFGPWTGHVGPLPDGLLERVEHGMSATSLQDWAVCPTSHFIRRVLGIRDLEDRASADNIDARDKGTLVHTVLEQFLRPHLGDVDVPGISPETPWTTDDQLAAIRLLETEAGALEVRGLTGRAVLWQAHLSRLRRALRRILNADSQLRTTRRSWPIRVEAAFGRDGVDPLVVNLTTQGPVPFAGYIDRVDATESGDLIVTDYKTGSGRGYKAIPELGKGKADADLIHRGQILQLVLYTLAARVLCERPDARIDAYFWFVEQGALHRGGVVDVGQTTRLQDVLDVVVGGIRGGVYPANPGEPRSFPRETWEACTFCPYDRVCPSTRLEQWRGVRDDPAVRPYADIADPQCVQTTISVQPTTSVQPSTDGEAPA